MAKCEASDIKAASMPDFPLQEGGRKFEKGMSKIDWNSQKVSRSAISSKQHRLSKASGQQDKGSRVTTSHCAAIGKSDCGR